MQALKILGHLWSLPLTLTGLVLALLSKPKRWSVSLDGIECFDCEIVFATGPGRLNARAIGAVITYAPNLKSAEDFQRTRVHEKYHVLQCLVLGPFAILTYPIAMAVAHLSGGHYYYDNWFEKEAREHAGQRDPRV